MKKILMIGFMCFALSAAAQTGEKLKMIISVYPAGAQKNFSNDDLKMFKKLFPQPLYDAKVQKEINERQNEAYQKKLAEKHQRFLAENLYPVCRPGRCPCKYYPPPCDYSN